MYRQALNAHGGQKQARTSLTRAPRRIFAPHPASPHLCCAASSTTACPCPRCPRLSTTWHSSVKRSIAAAHGIQQAPGCCAQGSIQATSTSHRVNGGQRHAGRPQTASIKAQALAVTGHNPFNDISTALPGSWLTLRAPAAQVADHSLPIRHSGNLLLFSRIQCILCAGLTSRSSSARRRAPNFRSGLSIRLSVWLILRQTDHCASAQSALV